MYSFQWQQPSAIIGASEQCELPVQCAVNDEEQKEHKDSTREGLHIAMPKLSKSTNGSFKRSLANNIFEAGAA